MSLIVTPADATRSTEPGMKSPAGSASVKRVRESAIFFGNRKTYRVGKIHGSCTGCDYRARYLLEVIRIDPHDIFR